MSKDTDERLEAIEVEMQRIRTSLDLLISAIRNVGNMVIGNAPDSDEVEIPRRKGEPTTEWDGLPDMYR